MKKTIIKSALLLSLLMACKKDVSSKAIASTSADNLQLYPVSVEDTVYFPKQRPGKIEDDGKGDVVCFLQPFKFTKDSAYGKQLRFSISKGDGAVLDSVDILIDGDLINRVRHNVNFGEDSIVHTIRHWAALGKYQEQSNRVRTHFIALRAYGNGLGWYQFTLEDAIFLTDINAQSPKPKYTTDGLPAKGDFTTYKVK